MRSPVRVNGSVLHVAINYKTPARAQAFVERFAETRAGESQTSLLVVDNSDDEEREQLRDRLDRLHPAARCLTAPANLGYFGGARFALEQTRGAEPAWTIVSNVDLAHDAGAVERALARHDPDSLAVVAPRIISAATGRDLNPYMRERPSSLRMHAYEYLYRSYRGLLTYSWLSDRAARSRVAPRSAPMRPGEPVYAAHGCFLILSRGYFARGGSLRHEPFLFGEEISIAEQSMQLGLPTICDPTIVITHDDHASTGKLPSRALHAYQRQAAAWLVSEFFQQNRHPARE